MFFPQTFGQIDQGDLRLSFTVPEVEIFANLDQTLALQACTSAAS